MSKTNVTFLRNVKLGEKRYAAKTQTTVTAEEFAALDAARAISYEEKPVKQTNSFDFAVASESELLKVKNDELKAYLESQSISFGDDAKKAELVHLILDSQEEQGDEVVIVTGEEGDE